MNICNYISTLPSPSIAGILACSGYALREQISLCAAIDEMGFTDIDTTLIKDTSSETQLAFLGVFCAAQIMLKNSNSFTEGLRA